MKRIVSLATFIVGFGLAIAPQPVPCNTGVAIVESSMVSYGATAWADTPLIVYKMDQASAGTGPTSLTDTGPGTAVNATCGYGTGSWTSNTAGDGRIYAGNGDQSGSLAGTKVAAATTGMSGQTNATWEVMVDTTGDPSGAPIACFGSTSSKNLFCLTTVSAASNGGTSAVAIDWDDTYSALCPMTAGLHYLAVAVDTTNATSTLRFNCYVDATGPVTLTSLTAPPQNTAADAVNTTYSTNRVAIGSFLGFQLTPGVIIYEAILYASTISSATAGAHNTAMTANNDADPNSGGATPAPSAFWFADSSWDHIMSPQNLWWRMQ